MHGLDNLMFAMAYHLLFLTLNIYVSVKPLSDMCFTLSDHVRNQTSFIVVPNSYTKRWSEKLAIIERGIIMHTFRQ